MAVDTRQALLDKAATDAGAAGTTSPVPTTVTFKSSQCGYYKPKFKDHHFYTLLKRAYKFDDDDPTHIAIESMKFMSVNSLEDLMMVDYQDIQYFEYPSGRTTQVLPKPAWSKLQLLHSHISTLQPRRRQ